LPRWPNLRGGASWSIWPTATVASPSGAAAFHVAASSFEAFAHAGKYGIDPPLAQWSRAFVEIAGRADEVGVAMDRRVSSFLGIKL